MPMIEFIVSPMPVSGRDMEVFKMLNPFKHNVYVEFFRTRVQI